MGVFKNGVGRPSNETIKKRNIFKAVCVVLVVIIVGLVGYILNDKGIININNKDDKKAVNNKKDTTKESKKENISNEEAKKIYNEVFNNDFDKNSFDTDDLLYMNSDKYKTSSSLVSVIKKNKQSNKYDAFKLLEDKLQKDGKYYIYNHDGVSVVYDKEKANVYTYEDIDSELKNIYGSDTKMYEDSFDYYQYIVIFMPNEKVYVVLENVYGDGGHTVLKSIIGAKKYENQVSFNILVKDVNWLNEKDCEFSFTSTKSNSKVCLSKEDIDNEDETLQKYKSDALEYKLIFNKRNDGTYYFNKVEKVK